MARRVIGQERFSFAEANCQTDLDALARLIDWSGPDALMGDISALRWASRAGRRCVL